MPEWTLTALFWLIWCVIPCAVIIWCVREIGREWRRIKARMVAPGSSFAQPPSAEKMSAAWKQREESNIDFLPRLPRTPLDDSGYRGE